MLPTLRRGRSVQSDAASPGRLVYLPEVWPHGDPRETRLQMLLSKVRRVETSRVKTQSSKAAAKAMTRKAKDKRKLID